MQSDTSPHVAYYILSGCPLCSNTLEIIEGGQNCPQCGSRSRTRSIVPLLQRYISARLSSDKAIRDKQLLGFAMVERERQALQSCFTNFKSASLYQNYGDDHEHGVDIRDLSRYADDSFQGFFGCLLFDYFLEHKQALEECFRVISPEGIFLTHIAPYRLVDGELEPTRLPKRVTATGAIQQPYPEEGPIENVKVGIAWFLNTMRGVGFESSVVHIFDQSSQINNTWFVGRKPSLSKQPLKQFSQHQLAPQVYPTSKLFTSNTTTLLQTNPVQTSLGKIQLRIEQIEILGGPSLWFLEDRIISSPILRRIITCSDRSKATIYSSLDNAQTWQQRFERIAFQGVITKCFTSSRNGTFIMTSNPSFLYRFDPSDKLISRDSVKEYPWHGSQGIGESASGAIIYGEYAPNRFADGSNTLRLRRLRANSDIWDTAMEIDAGNQPSLGLIRHFHVCTTLENNPHRWIVSSGDVLAHNRLWISDNDGQDWQEIFVKELNTPELPKVDYPRIFRFTSIASGPNGSLIWGTDDHLGKMHPALVMMKLGGASFRPEIISWLGSNLVRNIISLNENIFLLITESKLDTTCAEFFLVDLAQGSIEMIKLPNLTKISCSVTASLGSSRFFENTAFIPAIGNILTTSKRSILRISVLNS